MVLIDCIALQLNECMKYKMRISHNHIQMNMDTNLFQPVKNLINFVGIMADKVLSAVKNVDERAKSIVFSVSKAESRQLKMNIHENV